MYREVNGQSNKYAIFENTLSIVDADVFLEDTRKDTIIEGFFLLNQPFKHFLISFKPQS